MSLADWAAWASSSWTVGSVGWSSVIFRYASTACADYQDKVTADRPVAYWRFSDAASGEYTSSVGQKLPAKVEGNIETVPGPAADGFPDFAGDNRAIQFGGEGAMLRITDPGANSPLDFGLNDPITLEAWVRCDKLADGAQAYIIGKGRRFPPLYACT